MSARGSTWHKLMKFHLGAFMLPSTWRSIREREKEAEVMLQRFPQIPKLESRAS
jgi:hypothetical protein